MRCTKCGFENIDGAGFWGNCGNIINSSQSQQTTMMNNINNIPNQTGGNFSNPIKPKKIYYL